MITFGKFILESLTTGMYKDPMIIYREYIQNSTDSIDRAVKAKLISKEESRIDIEVKDEYISITDNGEGIPKDKVIRKLLDVGNSDKKYDEDRGFRGIGRLGGLSYCSKLKFITSSSDEKYKTTLSFDCDKLKKLLSPNDYTDYDAARVLKEISKHTIDEAEPEKSHFFKVILEGVRPEDEELVDIDEVKSFLSQTAPVPFNTHKFVYHTLIKDYFRQNGYELDEYKVFLKGNQIFKPYKSKFKVGGKSEETSIDVEIKNLKFEKNDELKYVLWYTDNDLLGQVKDKDTKSIRLRKGNILIGDDSTLNIIFSKTNSRFNGWLQGELHVFNNDLIPNSRRDDLEKNKFYLNFIDSLKPQGLCFEKLCRESSEKRSEAKIISSAESKLEETENVIKIGFSSKADKEKHKEELQEIKKKIGTYKPKTDVYKKKKEEIIRKIETKEQELDDNKDYLAKILSGYSKAEKKIIHIILDIISKNLERKVANNLIDQVINELMKSK